MTVPPSAPLASRRGELLGALVLLSGIAGAVAGACAGATPEPVDLAAYSKAQLACVHDNDTRTSIDECRGRARAQWCSRFPTMVDCDGGTVDNDR
jgi:hypothetical protein